MKYNLMYLMKHVSENETNCAGIVEPAFVNVIRCRAQIAGGRPHTGSALAIGAYWIRRQVSTLLGRRSQHLNREQRNETIMSK